MDTMKIQGGSNMTGTDLCVNKPHMSRSYLNHLVFFMREETKKNNQLNAKHNVCYNNIFEVIHDGDSHCSDAQYSPRAWRIC